MNKVEDYTTDIPDVLILQLEDLKDRPVKAKSSEKISNDADVENAPNGEEDSAPSDEADSAPSAPPLEPEDPNLSKNNNGQSDSPVIIEVDPSTPDNETSPDIQAQVSLGITIGINGRSSISTVCPHCKKSIETRIHESVNEDDDDAGEIQYAIICCCLVIVITVAFLIAAARTGELVWLLGIFVGVIFALVVTACSKCIHDSCRHPMVDITHFCPACNKELGTSSGKDELERIKRQRRNL